MPKPLVFGDMSIMQWQIPAELDVLSIEGYPLSYFQAGRGDPLILVHGSLNDYRSWQAQIPDLAQRCHVFAPSLRHYYPERWDGRLGDFSLARHAADIIELIRSLRLAPVHIVGHSRGGSVAYLVARDTPELVRSLVLAEPRGLEDLLPLDEAQAEGARSNDAIFLALHENLKTGCKEIAAEVFVDAFNGAGSWAAMSASQKIIILDNIGTSVDPGELPGMRCEDIARFEMPVLLVRGEKSLSRYERGLHAMRSCNPLIGEVAVIPGAPHGMHRVNPVAFNAIVTKFLAGVA